MNKLEKKKWKNVTKTIDAIIILLVIIPLRVWIFQLLWNYLMPMIFGLITITFWQSLLLIIFCNHLFKRRKGKFKITKLSYFKRKIRESKESNKGI